MVFSRNAITANVSWQVIKLFSVQKNLSSVPGLMEYMYPETGGG